MAADGVKQTSEQQMRTLQFNDKVSRLNREFIRQLQEWYKQCAHYDFSNSVKSYLEHMKRLDEMYSGKPLPKAVGTETPTASASGRVIAKAKRRIEGSANRDELNNSVKVSTPSGAPPRFSLGDVSVIKPNMDVTLTVPTPKAAESCTTKENTGSGGGRKRAIRGGGPAGGAETVVFRGSDTSAASSSSSAVLPTTTLPKPTPGFWSSQKRDSNINDTSKPTFTFGSSKISNSTEQDNNFLKVPPVSFGNGKPLNFSASKDDKSAPSTESTGSRGIRKNDEDNSEKKSPLSFPTFGSKKDDDGSEKKSQLSFPTFGSKQESDSEGKKYILWTVLSFPSFGSAKDEQKQDEKKPTLSFPSFGSTSTNTAPSGGLQFSFGSLPKSSSEGQKGDGSVPDEEEYVPPKVEAVEFEEPGATFSSKCSVFKLVEKQYTKLGVGMLHLKEVDGKKSVLVRAATAIGTVWVNALMNKTMKAVKADEKGEKIRLLCPASEKEISTYVIRFPSTKEATKVLDEIEAASK
ncbi:RanBD1 domain-containing protein [Trichostrongylus colubriformis]|uniref:RanBD1 domain-containing protein n=1 Tax=Trichostrongylus colubriformis TaxID=6319 RepID=A0AAN8J2T9_TRICO